MSFFDWEMHRVATVEGVDCAEDDCASQGTMTRYEIAPVPNESRVYIQIDLCPDHADDDAAWRIFDERVRGPRR